MTVEQCCGAILQCVGVAVAVGVGAVAVALCGWGTVLIAKAISHEVKKP